MAEPIKNVTVGGLTFNANHATAEETGTDENGKKLYTIYFNTGEEMTYPEQTTRYIERKRGANDISLVKGKESGREYKLSDVFNNNTARNPETGKYEEVSLFAKVSAEVTETISKGWFYDDTDFDISGVMGATFSTSKETVSTVTLTDSEDCTIDLSANESSWYGDKAYIEGGKNNSVILDDEDSAVINDVKIEGEGEADQKDY